MHTTNILMVVGSLRARSFNRILAQAAAGELNALGSPEHPVRVSFLDYADLPFMNQDIEFPAPEAVTRVRNALAEADGVWIVSPEYNHGIPGPLKNMLDWASRPLSAELPPVMYNKPVALSGAGGASNSCCMQDRLLATLAVMRANAMAWPCVTANIPPSSFATDTFVVDDELRGRIRRQAVAFLEFVEA